MCAEWVVGSGLVVGRLVVACCYGTIVLYFEKTSIHPSPPPQGDARNQYFDKKHITKILDLGKAMLCHCYDIMY